MIVPMSLSFDRAVGRGLDLGRSRGMWEPPCETHTNPSSVDRVQSADGVCVCPLLSHLPQLWLIIKKHSLISINKLCGN